MISFKQEFRTALVEELDARHLGGDSYHAEEIMKSLEEKRKHISDVIANRVGNTAQAQQINTGNKKRGTVGGRGANIRCTQSSEPGWHVCGSAFHILPKGWRIPSMIFV